MKLGYDDKQKGLGTVSPAETLAESENVIDSEHHSPQAPGRRLDCLRHSQSKYPEYFPALASSLMATCRV